MWWRASENEGADVVSFFSSCCDRVPLFPPHLLLAYHRHESFRNLCIGIAQVRHFCQDHAAGEMECS